MPGTKLFTFKSGGWVLTAGIVFAILGVAWNLRTLWEPNRVKPRGDGRTAASYGFDLSNAIVPVEKIVSSGMIVDHLRAIDEPRFVTPDQVKLMSEVERGKYLVPSDRVVGVSIGGETRCYPLRVLVWHEIVNDVVGGTPIAVTYNPLSAAIVVFDRRVHDATVLFGVSGLLLDSNLLMFDREAEPRAESLWSQLRAQAIAGPRAGTPLTILPSALSRYDRWVERHPDTTVLAPILSEADRYKEDVYGTYFADPTLLRYPVAPLPPKAGWPLKQRILVTRSGGRTRVQRLDPAPDEIMRPDAVEGPNGGEIVDGAIYAYWFAWYAATDAKPGIEQP